MTSIALFGTSADPPTTGHQQILSWLADHYDRVFVWASNNPFKSHQTPLEHRATMLRLLVEEIDPPCENVQFRQELSSPRSIVTIELARQLYPNAEFTFVIGSDLVAQLPSWYRIADVVQAVKLLVIPRPGHGITETDLKELKEMGADVAIANLTGLPVSSTTYRQVHDPHLLTARIEDYIHRERLYSCRDAMPKIPTR
ncbi:nicotinate-nucleotide adenylyltransferase [Microcoleus sp. FACHB-1515]|uniref:nicotinate-nucleotide adenylyltransferase n=1 Tax=Cyanophyceae TaxID=3028117 RepID=UPI00168595AB|nr:nicotinate-nucleotide adenylyltransferase [Microcoleus sp. FACHB-1515]MBD2089260.1 nicotinate-nucleotide adenylyltransferase [Microcoleus sp. FACHB-1515]